MKPLSTHRCGPGAIPLVLAGALLLGGVDSLNAQVTPPLPALLESDYLLSVGEVVDPARWRGAETVVGSTGETKISDRSQTQNDLLYVPRVVEGRSLEPGDLVQFFRLDRRIDDPTTHELLGSLLLPTGMGVVDSLAGETARVRVTDAFHPILMGDHVRVVTDAAGTWPTAISVAGAPGGRIAAFQEEKAIHPSFDRLFLRPEVAGSTAPGQVVELYRPGPVRDGVQLPETVLGKAMIVRAEGPIAAAVTYQLERADLAPGDLYRPVPPDGD
jgi:hypothetical protein